MSKLTGVTITGADDSTNIPEMIELSRKYPFVEWGILVSRWSEGGPRFPTRFWIDSLIEGIGDTQVPLNLSTHICGAWVKELLLGTLQWSDLPQILGVSQRVQINTHGEVYKSSYTFVNKLNEKPDKDFIFQWDGVNDHYAYAANANGIKTSVLIDGSHGAGVLPNVWRKPAWSWPTGYAGGLGPDNVVEQLEAIKLVACTENQNPYPWNYWIDMETRVRTSNNKQLDMEKVRKVLELTAPFVGK